MTTVSTFNGGFNDWLQSISTRKVSSGVTLYGHPDTRTSRSLWMARELEALGVLEVNHVSISSPDFFNEETDKINPNRRMPFLDDNGVAVFEAMAVNLYLVKKNGKDTPLSPQNMAEEADMLKWSFWAMFDLDMKLWELVLTGPARTDISHPWYTHPVVRHPNIPDKNGLTGEERYYRIFSHPRSALRERKLVEDFQKAMGVLEKSLTGRDFLTGSRFTAADLNVSAVLSWSRHLGTQALEPYPAVGAWLDRCCFKRPESPYFGVKKYEGPWIMYHPTPKL